ncbi:MAG: hypothetical protein AAFQ43_08670, partial [Bacteroidota bacterium]
MKKLFWYFVGDADCLNRGGSAGGSMELARELRDLTDLGEVIRGEGKKYSDDLVGAVSRAADSSSNERSEDVRWGTGDWPEGWELRFRKPVKGDESKVILEPGTVTLPWPPQYGELE